MGGKTKAMVHLSRVTTGDMSSHFIDAETEAQENDLSIRCSLSVTDKGLISPSCIPGLGLGWLPPPDPEGLWREN